MPLAADTQKDVQTPSTTAKRANENPEIETPDAKRPKIDEKENEKKRDRNETSNVNTAQGGSSSGKKARTQQQDNSGQKDDQKQEKESQEEATDKGSSSSSTAPSDSSADHHHKPHLQEAAANVVSALRVLAACTLDHTKHVASDVSEQLKQTARKGGELSTAAIHKGTDVTSQAVESLAQGATATSEALRNVTSQAVELTRDELPTLSEVKETAAQTWGALREQIVHGADLATEKLKVVGDIAMQTAASIGELMLADKHE